MDFSNFRNWKFVGQKLDIYKLDSWSFGNQTFLKSEIEMFNSWNWNFGTWSYHIWNLKVGLVKRILWKHLLSVTETSKENNTKTSSISSESCLSIKSHHWRLKSEQILGHESLKPLTFQVCSKVSIKNIYEFAIPHLLF